MLTGMTSGCCSVGSGVRPGHGHNHAHGCIRATAQGHCKLVHWGSAQVPNWAGVASCHRSRGVCGLQRRTCSHVSITSVMLRFKQCLCECSGTLLYAGCVRSSRLPLLSVIRWISMLCVSTVYCACSCSAGWFWSHTLVYRVRGPGLCASGQAGAMQPVHAVRRLIAGAGLGDELVLCSGIDHDELFAYVAAFLSVSCCQKHGCAAHSAGYVGATLSKGLELTGTFSLQS